MSIPASSQLGMLLLDCLRARTLVSYTSQASVSRRFVECLSAWAPRFMRRKLHRHWRGDVVDDAVQHLLMAITEGKADHLEGADEMRAVRWLSRVLLNYAVDQVRRGARVAPVADVETRAHGEAVEATICARQQFTRFASELRREVLFTGAVRTAELRACLVEDYFMSVFELRSDDVARAARNTFDQRRCRGRRAATAAWCTFRSERGRYEEFRDVAKALGLEAELSTGSHGRDPNATRDAISEHSEE